MRYLSALVLALCICGCASGPTHDYYSPAVVGAKFGGPVTMNMVDDSKAESEKCVKEGYTLVGRTDYVGKYPEAAELRAQAKRAGANHVVYSTKFIPAAPGSWSFRFGRGFGSGGTDGGQSEVHIAFLGK